MWHARSPPAARTSRRWRSTRSSPRTIMQQRFPDLSHRLYFRPEVHMFVEDGRSFVRRSPEKYQVLQATLVDTWASTAAGAFALSENNLYTTDAFRDYLNHLTDDGLLVFTRWGFDPPREIVAIALAGDRGARRAGRDGSLEACRGAARSRAEYRRLWRAGHRADFPQAAVRRGCGAR